MSFSRTYREVRRMVEEALLETDTARDIVRKSGVSPGARTISSPQIMGTFSRRNDNTGFMREVPSSGNSQFPIGVRMSRYADLTGFSELRLLASVVASGTAGATLFVSSTSLAGDLTVPIDSIGLKLSGWVALQSSPALLEWFIHGESAGSATLGLLQVQAR